MDKNRSIHKKIKNMKFWLYMAKVGWEERRRERVRERLRQKAHTKSNKKE